MTTQLRVGAQLSAQMRIRRPDEKLERRPRRVLKAVIQIVVGNGRADPERDLPSAVGEQINPIMMVVLHDTQRGMEHQPVQQVGELAQSAADALRRLPTLDHEPFAVALPRRGRSHEPPERKDFARPDEHARHFRRRASRKLTALFSWSRMSTLPSRRRMSEAWRYASTGSGSSRRDRQRGWSSANPANAGTQCPSSAKARM